MPLYSWSYFFFLFFFSFLFLWWFGFAGNNICQICSNATVYSSMFHMVWVDLLAWLQNLLFIWILGFGQREHAMWIEWKTSWKVLRGKMFYQNNCSTAVKPCCYVTPVTRNRHPETVLGWKDAVVWPSKAGLFVLQQMAKYFIVLNQLFIMVS